MSASLRRSRRATKKSSTYNVDDIVEIVRNSMVVKGRLAQLLTETSSPNPRWLIKFDGQPLKDEEVYEHSFSKPPSSESPVSEDNSSSGKASINMPPPPRRKSHVGSSSRKRGSGTSSEEEEATPSQPRNAKNLSRNNRKDRASESHLPTTNDVVKEQPKKNGKVSAREQRSRRRQAKIDDDAPAGAQTPVPGPRPNKRRVPPHRQPRGGKGRKRSRIESEGDSGEVVKVKFLTGTLYLYRGLHRRAEFVRRV